MKLTLKNRVAGVPWETVALSVCAGLSLLLTCRAASAQGLQDQIPPSEYSALVDLYNATAGASWISNSGWLDPQATSWFGVSVSSGHVSELLVYENQLNGSIPSSIGNLPQLNTISLSDNQLGGSIPDSVGNLTNLVDIDFGNNALSGTIPSSLANLTRLGLLFLEANQLSGNIPAFLGDLSQLQLLDLYGNQLSGSIPSSLGNLTNLVSVYLDYNELSGDMPDFSAFTNMLINISGNDLNTAPGSQSLADIEAMIAAGNRVYYDPQYPVTVGPILLLADGTPQVGLTGTPGQTYALQASTDLTNWQTLTNIMLIGSSGQFCDPNATNYFQRYYRASGPP
jgi:hypothetical protein